MIVSDNYRENIAYISKRYDFDSWTIQQVYSFDYGMPKSDPAFFKRLLNELKAYDKENMTFIDDGQREIESAEKNGIKGVLFQSNEQIIRELKE